MKWFLLLAISMIISCHMQGMDKGQQSAVVNILIASLRKDNSIAKNIQEKSTVLIDDGGTLADVIKETKSLYGIPDTDNNFRVKISRAGVAEDFPANTWATITIQYIKSEDPTEQSYARLLNQQGRLIGRLDNDHPLWIIFQ